jgi:nitrogen regulatory protein P-II 1
MKLVEAIVQPYRLTAVLTALERVSVERLTVLDGFSYRDADADPTAIVPSDVHVLRNVIIQVVVNDDFLERTVAAIEESARSGPTGRDGDGKILVVPVHETIQLGGADRGPGAV